MVEVFLRTKQPVDVVACNNDVMALGALEVFEQNGLKPLIVGIDATTEAQSAIKEDRMQFSVLQSGSQQGEYMIKAANQLVNKKRLKDIKYANKQETAIWVPLSKIDKSNAQ